jgi:hypothetical protein
VGFDRGRTCSGRAKVTKFKLYAKSYLFVRNHIMHIQSILHIEHHCHFVVRKNLHYICDIICTLLFFSELQFFQINMSFRLAYVGHWFQIFNGSIRVWMLSWFPIHS